MDARKTDQHLRPFRPCGQLPDDLFEHRQRLPAVPRFEVVVAGVGSPAPGSCRVGQRSQPRGLLAQLRRRGGGAARTRRRRSLLERGRDRFVPSRRRFRQVAGTLLRVADESAESPVHVSALRRIRSRVRGRGEQRMLEAHLPVRQDDDVSRLGWRQRIGRADRAADELDRRLRRGRHSEQCRPRLLGQGRNSSLDKHIECRRQAPAGLDPLGLSRQLEREERVASGKFVDPTKQWPREDDPEPRVEEAVQGNEVERSDRHV